MRRKQLRLVLAVLVLVVVAWFLFPGSFAHGMVLGFILTLAVLFGGALLFGKLFARRHRGRPLQPPPLPVTSWDYTMAVTDLEGVPHDFHAAADGVLILNFWATWCSPCIAELPSLQRLMAATADLKVRFGIVSREDAGVVRAFVAKRGFDLPFYLLSGEPPACFRTRGIPATYIIDRHGTIAMQHVGAAAWDDEKIVTFVRGLAARPG